MCMTANTGGTGWIAAPTGRSRKGAADSRFAVFGGEGQGPTYLFNTKGQLAAIGFERFALPIDALANDIRWIVENKKDVAPRQLGVRVHARAPGTAEESASPRESSGGRRGCGRERIAGGSRRPSER